MIIGLTGQSGAGKSTISSIFNKKEYFIINCDVIAHEVISTNKDCFRQLVDEFSTAIVDSDGGINRKALGRICFNDRSKLKTLDTITHPFIINTIKEKIKYLNNAGIKKVLLDAPTLFEAHAECLCDTIICVIADSELRLKRIMERDNISLEDATMRIRSQHNDEFYKERSDYVVYNNGSLWQFMNEIEGVIATIEAKQ